MRCLYRCRLLFSVTAIHRDSVAREDRIWCILFGCHHLSGLFICVPHALLSLGNGWKIIFKVSTHIVFTDNPFLMSHIAYFRLDYCGIALLIMGSFVPWLYYGFYCHYQHKLIYLSVVVVLGCVSIIVSLWDKFSEPNLRPLRAGKCCLLTIIL